MVGVPVRRRPILSLTTPALGYGAQTVGVPVSVRVRKDSYCGTTWPIISGESAAITRNCLSATTKPTKSCAARDGSRSFSNRACSSLTSGSFAFHFAGYRMVVASVGCFRSKFWLRRQR